MMTEVATSDAASERSVDGAAHRPDRMSRVRRLLTISELSVAASLIAAIAIFTLLEPNFLSRANIEAMLKAMSFIGIIAIGQTVLLISGEFDLSVGSIAGLSTVVAAWMMTDGGLPVVVGIGVGCVVGAGVGLINGLVVVKCGIPAFIATIGMLYVARGATYLITDGYPIYPLPELVTELGDIEPFGLLSLSFVVLAVLTLLGDFALRRTRLGRATYATGGNREVARIAGIKSDRIRIGAFMLVGFLSAVAGVLIMTTISSAPSDLGQGYELNVIAGVVIGGVSLFGGIGSIIGAFLGILLLQVVQSGLVIVGLNPQWQIIAVGLIMVISVGLDIVRRRATTG